MKNKKNWLKFLIVGLSVATMACFASACKSNDEPPVSSDSGNSGNSSVIEEKERFFERTVLSVLVYEDIILPLQEGYEAGDFIWSSSDETIATVNNGYVSTKKAGVVTITISKGDTTDTCVLTVEETSVVPTLTFNVVDKTLSLNQDSTYDLDVELSYNGNVYTDFTYSFTSTDATVATVDNDGLVTAVAGGEAKITATIQWKGMEVIGQVTVCVVEEEYITLSTTNSTLYPVCPQGFDLPTSVEITPVLNGNEGVISGVTFTLEEVKQEGVELGSVATCEGNTISAVGIGSATFVYKCVYEGKTYTSELITINVKSTRILLKEDFYMEKSDQDLYLDVSALVEFSTLDSAIVNGTEAVIRNNRYIQVAPLENGVYEVEFLTDGVDVITYGAQLHVADKLISSADDLKGLDANGYYVVTQNIDFAGANVNHLFSTDNWYAAETTDNGFQGIFDGNGHIFSNISVDSCGLFGNIGTNGVVKNLGVHDVVTRDSGYGWAFGLAMYVFGTIENVSYRQASTDMLLNSVIGKIFAAKISNFVVYAPSVRVSGFFNSVKSAGQYRNIWIVSDKANGNSQNAARWFSVTTYKTDDIFLAIDFEKLFDCSETGIWQVDRVLGLPMMKYLVSIEDETQLYKGTDLDIENPYFDEIISVSIDGNILSKDDYSVDGTTLTIKNEYLATIETLGTQISQIVVKTKYANYEALLTNYRSDVTGDSQEYTGEALVFENEALMDIKSVKVNGATIDASNYTIDGTTVTLNKSYLDTLTNWNNTLTIETLNVHYTAQIEIYTYINTLDDLYALTGLKGNPNAYYKLTADLDAKDYGKSFGRFFNANWWTALAGDNATVFQGVFDGQGHTISNIKVSEFGFFGTIGYNGIVKNVGFYNVNSIGTHATIDFGIATDLYGTLENVSYYQDETSDICAIVGRVHTTSKVNNFVGYVGNAKTCGFINTNSSANAKNFTNVYVVSNVFNNNSITFSTEFMVDTYLTDSAFLELDFTTIFDCSANGIWVMDETKKMPFIGGFEN